MTELEAYARQLAQQAGLDPDFVARIGQAESNWNPKAVSPKGALGPMQLMPATARMLGVNPADPMDNIRGGVQYLAQLHKQFGGDPSLVAAAYNAGPGAVQKAGGVPNYPETQKYVQKVAMPAIDPNKVQWDAAESIDPKAVKWDGEPSRGPEVSPTEAALIGAGKTFTRLGQGVKQAYYGLTGNQTAQDALAKQVAEENRLTAPLAQDHPLATMVGESLPVLAGGPVTMGAAGGLEYGTPEEKALRAGAGFVGGKAGELGGKLLGRALNPIRGAGAEAISGAQDLLSKYGMSGLPGQVTQSAPIQWLESTLSKLPGGGRIRSAVEAQQQGLNKAVMGAMGSSESAVTPEAIQAAKGALGQTFEKVPAGQVVAIDKPVADRLLQVEQDHLKNLSPDQRTIVRQYVDDILAHGENGMPGDVYQKARSRIAARANSTQDSELKTALTGIYKTLDQAFVDSASPEASAAMKAARAQYRVAKTIEPMANVAGDVSPARLANAAKNLPGSDLPKLAAMMKGLPDSGTAQRLFYQSLLSGGMGAGAAAATGDPMKGLQWGAGTAAAQLAAPWLASQLLTRAPTKGYITNGLLSVSPEIEKLLMRAGSMPGGLLGLELTR